MGQVKQYGEWAKEEGYLDKNYKPKKKGTKQMDWVDEYIKARDSNMASSHFYNATAVQLEAIVKNIHKKEKK
jgi:hypothetical protein